MPESPKKEYKTRSRVSDPSYNASPVFSTFPDQAARERAALTAPSSRAKKAASASTSSKITKAAATTRGPGSTGRPNAGGSGLRRGMFPASSSFSGISRTLGGGGLRPGGQGVRTAVATSQSAASSSACDLAVAGLAECRTTLQNRGGGMPLENPAIFGSGLYTETVFQALAAVTEAISNLGSGVQFSLLDAVPLTGLDCARPGNELLIPITAGTGNLIHTTLYVVRRTGDNTFALRHFDSAKGHHQRNATVRTSTSDTVRGVLTTTRWSRGTTATISTAVADVGNSSRQRDNWECGIHVVLYGWAYALGLRLGTNSSLALGAMYTEFLTRAVEIINLALQGVMTSQVIKDFMECYGFIQAGQEVPADRVFNGTEAVQTMDDLRTAIVMSNSISG